MCPCPRCWNGLFEGSASHDSACPSPASSALPQFPGHRGSVARHLLARARRRRQSPECGHLGGGERRRARTGAAGAARRRCKRAGSSWPPSTMQKGIRLNDGHVASLGLLARKDGTRKGYLSKRSSDNTKWQTKWFALLQNLLFYFESDSSSRPSGLYLLEGCVCDRAPSPKPALSAKEPLEKQVRPPPRRTPRRPCRGAGGRGLRALGPRWDLNFGPPTVGALGWRAGRAGGVTARWAEGAGTAGRESVQAAAALRGRAPRVAATEGRRTHEGRWEPGRRRE